MLNFFQPKSGKFIMLLVGVFALGACSRLVTPDQTTEITEVRAGQYRIAEVAPLKVRSRAIDPREETVSQISTGRGDAAPHGKLTPSFASSPPPP